MDAKTIRRATIVVAEGKCRTRVYQNLEEVPAPVRRRLIDSTSGPLSATIIIADRGGREEIVRALRGLPSRVQSRLGQARAIERERRRQQSARQPVIPPPLPPPTIRGWLRDHWVELLLPGAVGAAVWFLFSFR